MLQRIIIGVSAASILGVIVLLLVAIFIDDGGRDDDVQAFSPGATATPQSSSVGTASVEYRITTTGSPRMNLTMMNGEGGTEQHTVTASQGVWSQTLRMQPGTAAYVSAQNRGDSGTVTCEILVNGDVVNSATSTGGQVIASCSARVND